MNWRVGVLRAAAENTDWTAGGAAEGWATARRCAIGALHQLVQAEGCRQEYRMDVDDVELIVWPGLDGTGPCGLDLSGVDVVLPHDRDAAAAIW